jgi:hypothetical protein
VAKGRVRTWFERLVLGAIMTVAAFVVERRLLKVIKQRGESGSEDETPTADPSAELTTPTA